MTPDDLARAECRRRGIPTAEFVPKEGATPSARALAACSACPVAGPCAADRGNDIGLRGDGFVEERSKTRPRNCERCGLVFRARGGGYRLCEWCARVVGARRQGGAA